MNTPVTSWKMSDDWSFVHKTRRLVAKSVLPVSTNKEALCTTMNEWCSLVYVKVPKAGSSTAAGVSRRLSEFFGLNGTRSVFPEMKLNSIQGVVWANHKRYHKMSIPGGAKYFLWSIVRHPAARCRSFALARIPNLLEKARKKNGKATDQGAIAEVKSTCRDFQYSYLKPDACSSPRCVFETYNLLGTVEHFDATLTLLAKKLKTPLSAVLYVSASKNSTTRNRTQPSSKFAYLLDKLIQGPDFERDNRNDHELWLRATHNIEKYTQAATLSSYMDLRTRAAHACENSTNKDCYYGDNGCAVKCLNRFASSSSKNSSKKSIKKSKATKKSYERNESRLLNFAGK